MIVLNTNVLIGMLVGIGISTIISGIGIVVFFLVADEFKEEK